MSENVKKRRGRPNSGYTVPKCDRSPSGEIIEDARMDLNLSLVEVGYLAKLNPATIGNVERFGVLTTKVQTLLSICKVLELDPMELIKADIGDYISKGDKA